MQGSQGCVRELDLTLHQQMVQKQEESSDVATTSLSSSGRIVLSASSVSMIPLQVWRPRFRSPLYLNRAVKTHFSWLTARDPLQRLLSAYRDKFFLNGNKRYEQEKVERWYKMYGRKIIEKYRTDTPEEVQYQKAPTFKEFVQFLVDTPVSQYDPHWKPMFIQCLPCHIQVHDQLQHQYHLRHCSTE